jgi:hypothetical protein
MDTTVTILNWKRTENLNQHILPSLNRNPRVSEVFVVNNNPSEFGHIRSIDKVRVFEAGRDLGLDARFSVAFFAKTPLVFIQDDDLMISESAMNILLDASLRDYKIHGVFGRRPKEGNQYADFVDRQNSGVEMVITRALACKRASVASFFTLRETGPVLEARARHKEFSTNPENGEDIIFSYALRAANWGDLHQIHALKPQDVTELPDFGDAQWRNSRFSTHRTAIMRACQEATGLF